MNTLHFEPHPLFKSGDLQTVAAAWWPKTKHFPKHKRQTNRVRVSDDNTLIVYSHLQIENPAQCDDILLVHGFEGSSESKYMLRMAKKGLLRGFNVHRMNLRSCGDSIDCCRLPYHAGLWQDILQVAKDVKTGQNMFITGFSLGGNLSLKMAGELGDSIPSFIKAVSSVSAPVDLKPTLDWMKDQKMYQRRFLGYIMQNYRRKKELFPGVYPELDRYPQTLREFDEKVMCPIFDFRNADEYYQQSSCCYVLPQIAVPTMMIFAKDDPLIPNETYEQHILPQKHDHIQLVHPDHGGHVAFIGKKHADVRDRFWSDACLFRFFAAIR